MLYVVTMNDSIYAFDAAQNVVLWQKSLINPANGITPIPIADITGNNELNIVGNVGIESTPVIDPGTNTMYLLARTKEVTSTATNYVQRLHAVDITTGAEKFGGPVVIAGSVSGTGEESSNGTVSFDPFWENQRVGLALAGGQVILMWASHEDDQPYHGWVMAYSASTLAQTGIVCVTPNGSEGGIWMSGRAPVIDTAGNIYLITGNGTDDQERDFGESFLRLSTAGGTLHIADYFIASNFSSLNSGDTDLGSSGPLLIPGANLLLGGGKQGVLYLLNPANLGHYAPNDSQIPQKFQAVTNLIFPGPAYWKSASKGQLIYIWAQNDVMRAYAFNGSTFDTTPVIQSTVKTSSGENPGGTLAISSSANRDASAIVWASMTISGDEYHGLTPGMLRAVDALTGAELWNSQMDAGRDAEGSYLAKFVSPTVVNGKVYMATFSDYTTPNSVVVYGLLTPSSNFTLEVVPANEAIVPGGTPAAVNVSVTPEAGHSFLGAVKLSASGLPTGITASFSPEVISGSGSSVLTLTAAASAALGQSNITVTGTGLKSGNTSAAVFGLTVTIQPGAVSANFVGNGMALNATDLAGVMPKSQWNNLTGASGAVSSLTDEFGNGTGISVTWLGDNPWKLPSAPPTPNGVMMQGYLDDQTADTTTVIFSGLPLLPDGYTVYVYSDGDNQNNLRTGTYTVSGTNTTTQSIVIADLPNSNFNGTFTEATSSSPAGNYTTFSVSGGSFTLTATPQYSVRAPVNGIQIIPN